MNKPLSGIYILPVNNWALYDFDKYILARHDSKLCSLQFTTAFRYDCGNNPSTDLCFKLLESWLEEKVISVFREFENKSIKYGRVDVGQNGNEGSAWYAVKDNQFLAGLLLWSSGQRDDELSDSIDSDIELMIQSMEWLSS